MKNLYLIIIAFAFFSDATAQLIPAPSQSDLDLRPYVDETPGDNYSDPDGDYSRTNDFTNHSGYNSIIIHGYNILWVFNDVGNRSTNRNGNSDNTIPEIESSNSTVVETSVFPVPAKDHLNFTFGTDINSGMIIIHDAGGKIILTQKFSGNEAIIASGDFIPGIYFYLVKSGTTIIKSGKLMKN